jgi:NTE family protein
MTNQSKPRLGIALGGGGSRAFVHLGVLAVLENAGIEVSAISGSSMGAILGAIYAYNPDAAALREKTLSYFSGSKMFGMNPKPSKNDGLHIRRGAWGWMKKFARTVSIAHVIAARRGLLGKNVAHRAIDDLLPDGDISETALPFSCVALNLTDGELVTFRDGNVRQATKAGTAIGVVYKPYEWGGLEYADAAPVSSVPVHACRKLGADVVLAIDVRTPKPEKMVIQNGFDVISRIEMIQSGRLNDEECDSAEILLKPDVGNVFWGDFTNLAPIVEAGAEAMRKELPRLKELLGES